MACGSCGGQSTTVADAQQALAGMLGFATGGTLSMAPIPDTGTVRMEFVGDQWGEQSYIGRVTGRVYRAGRDPVSRFHDVDVRDVEHLVALEKFRVVPRELLAQAAQAEDVPAAVMQQAIPSTRGRKR